MQGFARQATGLRESDDGGHVERARPDPALLASALHLRLQPHRGSTPAPGQTEIRWYCCLGGGDAPEQVEVEKQVVERFNASHPNIHVTFEAVPYAGANDALATEIASGNDMKLVFEKAFSNAGVTGLNVSASGGTVTFASDDAFTVGIATASGTSALDEADFGLDAAVTGASGSVIVGGVAGIDITSATPVQVQNYLKIVDAALLDRVDDGALDLLCCLPHHGRRRRLAAPVRERDPDVLALAHGFTDLLTSAALTANSRMIAAVPIVAMRPM